MRSRRSKRSFHRPPTAQRVHTQSLFNLLALHLSPVTTPEEVRCCGGLGLELDSRLHVCAEIFRVAYGVGG